MRPLLDFDDAGASDGEPVKGVTVGDIRAWFDEIERLQEAKRASLKLADERAIEANGLRALVKGGLDAINAAICQTQAEQAGHERTADKYCRTVEQWRKDARAALTDEQGKS